MRTRFVHPSYYLVKPDGQTARVFQTVAQAATALVALGETQASICVITGSQVRRLNQPEMRELRRRIVARERAMPEGPAWSRMTEVIRSEGIDAPGATDAGRSRQSRESASV